MPSALKCGAHWPIHQPSAQALARSGGQASALHNNCSGKHSGFLCAACAMGADTGNYVEATHPVQREVKAAIESLTGAALSQDVCAVDGCSVPTWAMPLGALARGFARFGTGEGLPSERAKAAARLRAACAQHPWHVAGTGRFCTELMRTFGERVFVKTGAEGVACAALPTLGLGHRGEMRRRRRPRRGGHAGGGDRALSQLRCRPCRAGALRPAGDAQLERNRGRLAAANGRNRVVIVFRKTWETTS